MPCEYHESTWEIEQRIRAEVKADVLRKYPNGQVIIAEVEEKLKKQQQLLAEAQAKIVSLKAGADEATRVACELTHDLYRLDKTALLKLLKSNEFVNKWFWLHQEQDMKANRSFFALIGSSIREVDGTYHG